MNINCSNWNANNLTKHCIAKTIIYHNNIEISHAMAGEEMKIMALLICAICFHVESRENSIEDSVYLLTNSIYRHIKTL